MASLISATELQVRGPKTIKFPPGFLWGVATAAHQVEGGNHNNQWSAWEAAGRIKSGETSGSGCNWWQLAEQDFDIAAGMGLNALRLSLEWSRIEPRPGEWNQPALQRYREMLQALKVRGIRPFVTLHHFTHPLWFETDGAFTSRSAPARFDAFVRRVVAEMGDLCRHWVTINEPNVFASLGYVLGEFPPGDKGEIGRALRVINGMVRCHAQAYHAIHQLQPDAAVGWAHNFVVFRPANEKSLLDRWCARLLHYLFNESFLATIEDGEPGFPLNLIDKDFGGTRGACDFVGLNVYSRFHVAFSLQHAAQLFCDVHVPKDVPQGDSGIEKPYGEAFPAAISAAVQRAARLGKPLYLLENGVPDSLDRIRPWLIVNAVRETQRLIEEGNDLRGYFHWTLTDNFEWSEGWGLKFGLIELDRATQRRAMRGSGRLYSAIVKANGLTPEITAAFPISDSRQP